MMGRVKKHLRFLVINNDRYLPYIKREEELFLSLHENRAEGRFYRCRAREQ